MKKSTTSPDAVPTAALNCFVGLFNQHLPLAVQLCERQMQPRLVDWNWWSISMIRLMFASHVARFCFCIKPS
jgi:hypothetical protein